MTSLSHSAFVSFLSVLSVFSLTNFSLPRNTSLSINLSLLSLLYLTPSSPYYTSLPSPSSPYYTSLPPLPTIPHSLLPPPSSPYYTSLPPLPTIPHSLLVPGYAAYVCIRTALCRDRSCTICHNNAHVKKAIRPGAYITHVLTLRKRSIFPLSLFSHSQLISPDPHAHTIHDRTI